MNLQQEHIDWFRKKYGNKKILRGEKAWKTRRLSLCVVCHKKPRRSKTAKTCCQRCAGFLAWQTRREQE